VRKAFGRTSVLRGVTLHIPAGERVALIGPNGAGKSTLFDVASGRVPIDAGAIRLHGARIDGRAPHRIRRAGLARSFQISSVFARLTAFDNLRCAALAALGQGFVGWRSIDRMADANDRAEALLARLGLAHRRDVPAGALTYAEQRALDLGLALAGDADVLLLDEPTAGMSRSESARFAALLREATAGRTLLIVEHDLDVAFDLADRVAVLVQGEVIAFDTPAAVRADARVRAAYLGTVAVATPGERTPC
jgi:branched-chain amino acid transport system ATP-binding protein